MNNKQQWVILIGCFIVVGMTVFPPHRGVVLQSSGLLPNGISVVPGDGQTRFIGYHFIWAPPDRRKSIYRTQLDIERLAAQIVAVVLITCGLAVVFQRRKTD